ncbi:MAG: sugar phosphate nucleotidyltransferase [Oscillospiraceae bacterium]|nr:sugar phosphate nucleotidyltransferase [Oscillospiraceae bacterium]
MVTIVLAAGYATRLYPITLETPKALLKIGNKTMLDHIMDKIDELGNVAQTVIVSNDKFYNSFVQWKDGREGTGRTGVGVGTGVGEGAGRTGEGVGTGVGAGVGADGRGAGITVLNDGTVSEQTRLGAIGDIRFAIEALSIDDEVMVVAGDNFFTFRLTDFYDFYRRADADCVVVKKIADREALKGLGVAVIGPGNQVLDFEEKPAAPKSDYAVYASYLYKKETLPLFSAYLDAGNPKDAPGNFPAWLCKRKRVAAYAFDGECYDVGTPEAYRDICAMYA